MTKRAEPGLWQKRKRIARELRRSSTGTEERLWAARHQVLNDLNAVLAVLVQNVAAVSPSLFTPDYCQGRGGEGGGG